VVVAAPAPDRVIPRTAVDLVADSVEADDRVSEIARDQDLALDVGARQNGAVAKADLVDASSVVGRVALEIAVDADRIGRADDRDFSWAGTGGAARQSAAAPLAYTASISGAKRFSTSLRFTLSVGVSRPFSTVHGSGLRIARRTRT
jgi:hypothetical protein